MSACLTLGSYNYSGGSDSLTVNIGVPEPSTWATTLAGFGGLAFAGFRARRRASLAA